MHFHPRLALFYLLFIGVMIGGCRSAETEPGVGMTGITGITGINSDTEKSPRRPNIIFILVDDLGWSDPGYLGSEINTPNLDKIAASGVRLEHSYAFPICSPTRAALMTGKTPLRFGIDGPMENDAMLPEHLTLLPEYLRRAGYQTWMVGKWHLGMSRRAAMPHARGFDYFYGHLGGFIDFYTHVYFGGLDWQRNGESLREEGYATDLLTEDAVRLLTEYESEQPFFLYLSYNAPHTPLQYPPGFKQEYSDIDRLDRRVFAQMTTYMDAAVGEIMATLKRQQLSGNTLVIFMSDNGGNLEAGADNGNLRGGKGSAYEGGVRVPTLMLWPQGLAGGRSYRQPVFVQDWLPTLLDASGVDFVESDFDGRSVWHSIVNDTAIRRASPVVIGTAKSKAVYDWPWKLVRKMTGNDTQHPDQLYHLVTDPNESANVAEQYSAQVAHLASRLERWPATQSKAAKGPPPESLFRKANGEFDYTVRKPETREPWAEAAAN